MEVSVNKVEVAANKEVSANNVVAKLVARGRSLAYIKNSSGFIVEPCGSPQVIFNLLDLLSNILVY